MAKKAQSIDCTDEFTGETMGLEDLRRILHEDRELAQEIPARAVHDFCTIIRVDPPIDWGPSLTRQEFADECDINILMARYERTGAMPPLNQGVAQYIDLTTIPSDYQTALTMLADAETAFMSLPATVRREFNNDPREFVEFASDPENLPQMQTWGLAPPTPTPEPEPAPAASPAPAAAPVDSGNGGPK